MGDLRRPSGIFFLILGVILTQFGCCCGLGTAAVAPSTTPSCAKIKTVKHSCCDQEQDAPSKPTNKLPKSCPCKDQARIDQSSPSEAFDFSKFRITPVLLSNLLLIPALHSTPGRVILLQSPPRVASGQALLVLFQTFRC